MHKNANWILSEKHEARERYPSEEEKNKKRSYGRERYKGFSEEEKEKKRQYKRERYKNLY